MTREGAFTPGPDPRAIDAVRERLLRFGAEALSPSELLGIDVKALFGKSN